jgi:3-hydroxyacyl-CoA dehydrogenase / enoyl-CoA hydratase / 3-hydroxybutyryl-CoA epimerase
MRPTYKHSYQHFRIDASAPDRTTIWIDVHGRSVNALSNEVFDELLNIIDCETERAGNLPLVFRSAKRDSFVVGADLRFIASIETDAQIQEFLLQGQFVFDRLEHFSGTTVAVIHGPCLGGGLELALACDYRVAVNSANTQLGMPEAKLGLLPGWGGTRRLIETVGVADGLPLLLTGDSVNAQRACELQLVDAIVQESSLDEELTNWLLGMTDPQLGSLRAKNNIRELERASLISELEQMDLASFGPLSASQSAIYHAVSIGLTQSIESGLRAERELFYPLLMSEEVQQKLRKFANRPEPSQ